METSYHWFYNQSPFIVHFKRIKPLRIIDYIKLVILFLYLYIQIEPNSDLNETS